MRHEVIRPSDTECFRQCNEEDSGRYYAALVNRDGEFDLRFYCGVASTGIVCRSVCSAPKPSKSNCEFYTSALAAVLSGKRLCLRCSGCGASKNVAFAVKAVVSAVERDVIKRWSEKELLEAAGNVIGVKAHFSNIFGLSLVEYARARRTGIFVSEIQNQQGRKNNNVGLGRQTVRDLYGAWCDPVRSDHSVSILYADVVETPLGEMLSLVNDDGVVLLEFVDRRGLEREIERVRCRFAARIDVGNHAMSSQLRVEVAEYFGGRREAFTIPVVMRGSAFQQCVWRELQKVRCGELQTYGGIAGRIGLPTSARAIGRANGDNMVAIILPCHRVVGKNGEMVGYGGGIRRKQWLLKHESAMVSDRLGKYTS